MDQPISSRKRRQGQLHPGCLVFFFLVFAVIGGAGFYFFFVKPMGLLLASRSWQETTCTVRSSQVAESSDSDGTTYKVDITYTYAVGGGERQSNRYNFSDAYSSGYDGKRAVVDRHPPGTRVACWVDPEQPDMAVLSRDFSPEYLLGLLPLIFLLVGVGGIVFALRSGRQPAAQTPALAGARVVPATSPWGISLPPDASEAVELRPKVSRMAAFLGLIVISLFWNGIVSVFVWKVYQGWRQGEPEGCLTAFMVPFVLVGLLLIYALVRQALVFFVPRPILTLSPRVPALGQTAYLQWRLTGRAAGVRKLRIVLEGLEEATYRRGTDTRTDREAFAKLTIVETTDSYQMAEGSTSFFLPADLMPSFKSDHNKIVWSLKVHAEVPGWPDSEDEFEVLLRPAGGKL